MSKTTITYKDIPPGADETAVFSSNSGNDFSNVDLLRHENDNKYIATFERNLWVLNGKFSPRKDEIVPFWSYAMSGENCVFDTHPVIEITFPVQYSSSGISFIFDDIVGGFCCDVNVKWYQGGELVSEGDFIPDDNNYYCIQRAVSWDRIVITFRKTFLPYRRVKLRQIIFGVIRKFEMDEIRSATILNQLNLISAEVPICTLNWTLDSRDNIEYMFQFKQTVEVRNDDFLLGAFYISETSRLSRTIYSLRCVDAFGAMNDTDFSGGVYSNKSAKELFLEIVGGDFDVDFGSVADTKLTGVLQLAPRRDALQQVLFAWGACAATDGGKVIRVFHPGNVPEAIGLNRSYVGVSVNTAATVTAVQIVAHSYERDDEKGTVEIDGKKYIDTQTLYTVRNKDVTANEKENVLKVESATLVSPSIGQATAQRVYDYYMRKNTAKSKIVWAGELLGDCLTLPTAWSTVNTGNISSISIKISNTIAADCEVIA